jgi:tryptophan synthase alpha chain
VGFGIRDAITAAVVARMADAVVVGSAVVFRIEALSREGVPIVLPVAVFVTELRTTIDAGLR